MKLYLVRHGESTGNVENKYFQPQTEELSETGKKQAAMVAKRFKNIPVDHIITSDYTRAMQTGDIIQKEIGGEIERTPLLRERRGNSKYKEKPWMDDDVQAYLQRLKSSPDMNYKEHDEETIHDLLIRAEKFFEFIQTKDYKTVVAVSHGIFIKMLTQVLIIGRRNSTAQITHHFMDHSWMVNTSVTLFEEWEPGKWWMLSWGDHEHLS